jgi:hypothetical protein
MNPLQIREDEIGKKLAEAQESGELKAAESYGKPMKEDTGWEQTPDEFRMGFKILKNAGVVPPEVELFHERAKLRAELEACALQEERLAVQVRLSQIEQKISLRLESLRSHGSL